MRQQKIFVGFFNKAPFALNYIAGFKQAGYEVTSADLGDGGKYVPDAYRGALRTLNPGPKVDFYKDSRIGFLMNYVYAFYDGQRLWEQVREEHDIFIFIGSSFFVEGHDLKELSAMGKKTAVVFTGDQMLWPSALMQQMLQVGLGGLEGPPEWVSSEVLGRKGFFLRAAEKTSDLVIHQSSLAQLALRPYLEFKYPIDRARPLECVNHDVSRPVVLHAPRDYAAEGTIRILRALESLSNRGVNFDFQLIKDQDYYKAVGQLAQGHIYVGNLGLPHAGSIEFEALARGLTVLTSAPSNLGGELQRQAPFLDAPAATLENVLESAITNPQLRTSTQEKGLRYIALHHDAKEVCAEILKGIAGEIDDRLIKPRFFAEKFVPPNESEAVFHSNTLRQLNEERWYRKAYRGFERAGIKF